MLRSLVSSSRAVVRSNSAVRFRAIATTPKRLSDAHHAPPALLGEGAPDGSVPTDENQSTGLERLQLLGHLEGIDVFDMQPLEVVKLGTKKDPILVKSYVRFFVHAPAYLHIAVKI
jgi:cytochrome c oxidase subunit 5b